jgi:hypothetical protein
MAYAWRGLHAAPAPERRGMRRTVAGIGLTGARPRKR